MFFFSRSVYPTAHCLVPRECPTTLGKFQVLPGLTILLCDLVFCPIFYSLSFFVLSLFVQFIILLYSKMIWGDSHKDIWYNLKPLKIRVKKAHCPSKLKLVCVWQYLYYGPANLLEIDNWFGSKLLPSTKILSPKFLPCLRDPLLGESQAILALTSEGNFSFGYT